MKKVLKSIVSVALVVMLLLSSTAFAAEVPATRTLSLSSKSVTIRVDDITGNNIYEIADLVAKYSPKTADPDLAWTSSNEEVATVEANDDGVHARVYAQGFGTAIISVNANDGSQKYANCVVNVVPRVKVKSVSFLNKAGTKASSDTLLLKDDSETVYTVGTVVTGVEKEDFENYFTVESSNEAIAEYQGYDQETGELTFNVKGAGKCTLTLTALDGSRKKARLNLNAKGENLVSKVTLTNAEGAKVATAFNLTKDSDTYELKATVAAKTGTPSIAGLLWTSSDENVATVEPTEAGATVTFNGAGKAKITAKTMDGSNRSASVTFTSKVNAADMADRIEATFNGETVANKEIKPVELGSAAEAIVVTATAMKGEAEAFISDVVWKNSSKSVAQMVVTDEGIEITPLKAGTAKFTATAKDGSKKTLTFSVKVTLKPVTGISSDNSTDGNLWVQTGSITKLSTSFDPADAYLQTLTYASSDKKIITIDADGYMSAIAEGSAKVTVTSKANRNAKYVLSVKVTDEQPTVYVTGAAIVNTADDKTAAAVKSGDELGAVISTSIGTIGYLDDDFDANYLWYFADDTEKTAIGENSTLTVTDTMIGKAIACDVSHDGYEGEATAKATDVVTPNFTFVGASAVDENGKAVTAAVVGAKLTATPVISLDTPNENAVWAYSWQVEGAEAPVTEQVLTITDAMSNKKITLTISGKINGYDLGAKTVDVTVQNGIVELVLNNGTTFVATLDNALDKVPDQLADLFDVTKDEKALAPKTVESGDNKVFTFTLEDADAIKAGDILTVTGKAPLAAISKTLKVGPHIIADSIAIESSNKDDSKKATAGDILRVTFEADEAVELGLNSTIAGLAVDGLTKNAGGFIYTAKVIVEDQCDVGAAKVAINVVSAANGIAADQVVTVPADKSVEIFFTGIGVQSAVIAAADKLTVTLSGKDETLTNTDFQYQLDDGEFKDAKAVARASEVGAENTVYTVTLSAELAAESTIAVKAVKDGLRANAVTLDVKPILSNVTIKSDNAEDATAATIGNKIIVTFKANQELDLTASVVTIDGKDVTLTKGEDGYKAEYTIADYTSVMPVIARTENAKAIPFSITPNSDASKIAGEVVKTADSNTDKVFVSYAFDNVSIVNPSAEKPTEKVTAAHVGDTYGLYMTMANGKTIDSEYIENNLKTKLAIQWYGVDAKDNTKETKLATTPTYTVVSDDIGYNIKVTVNAVYSEKEAEIANNVFAKDSTAADATTEAAKLEVQNAAFSRDNNENGIDIKVSTRILFNEFSITKNAVPAVYGTDYSVDNSNSDENNEADEFRIKFKGDYLRTIGAGDVFTVALKGEAAAKTFVVNPVIESVSVASNNNIEGKGAAWAKTGDTITATVKTKEAATSVIVTMFGDEKVAASADNLTWTATYKVTDATEGTIGADNLVVKVTDNTTTYSAEAKSTTDDSKVEIYSDKVEIVSWTEMVGETSETISVVLSKELTIADYEGKMNSLFTVKKDGSAIAITVTNKNKSNATDKEFIITLPNSNDTLTAGSKITLSGEGTTVRDLPQTKTISPVITNVTAYGVDGELTKQDVKKGDTIKVEFASDVALTLGTASKLGGNDIPASDFTSVAKGDKFLNTVTRVLDGTEDTDEDGNITFELKVTNTANNVMATISAVTPETGKNVWLYFNIDEATVATANTLTVKLDNDKFGSAAKEDFKVTEKDKENKDVDVTITSVSYADKEYTITLTNKTLANGDKLTIAGAGIAGEVPHSSRISDKAVEVTAAGPVITDAAVTSNNPYNNKIAAVKANKADGESDTVTLTFTSDVELAVENVTLCGESVAIVNTSRNAPFTYTATHTVDADDTGFAKYTITAKARNNIVSTYEEQTSDVVLNPKGAVIDKTSIKLESSNANANKAVTDDTLTLTFKTDKHVTSNGTTINDVSARVTSVADGSAYLNTAVIDVTSAMDNNAKYSIAIKDDDHIISETVSLDVDPTVYVNPGAPSVTDNSFATSNENSKIANTGDKLTLTFTTAREIKSSSTEICGHVIDTFTSEKKEGNYLNTIEYVVTADDTADKKASYKIVVTDICDMVHTDTVTTDISTIIINPTTPAIGDVEVTYNTTNADLTKDNEITITVPVTAAENAMLTVNGTIKIGDGSVQDLTYTLKDGKYSTTYKVLETDAGAGFVYTIKAVDGNTDLADTAEGTITKKIETVEESVGPEQLSVNQAMAVEAPVVEAPVVEETEEPEAPKAEEPAAEEVPATDPVEEPAE